MTSTTLALFVGGLALMLGGAELLVRGAAQLARTFGVPSLVVGLTVVAWGTGSPELAVGLTADLADHPALNIGNVVGSNIANILLVLGFAALLLPLTVSRRLVRFDIPLMIGVSILALLASFDGRISTLEGLAFVSSLFFYTVWTIRESRRARQATFDNHASEGRGATDQGDSKKPAPIICGVIITVGLFLVVKGSAWFVEGAVAIARAFGLTELVIGLTVVAIGTSLPELATSAVAVAKGERAIAAGNAIGSNIFNLLAVLGITAIIAPDGIPVPSAALSLNLPIMIGVAIFSLLVFLAGHIMTRWNGALFLALYAAYNAYIVLEATQHAAFSSFNTLMTMLVLPLTTLTLVALAYQSWRNR
ncbi:MAG: calcium/sodium antiporter [Acidobacteriota bacterium]|nr:calcium/sodium antiporter [Acidobacteriota bacterium]